MHPSFPLPSQLKYRGWIKHIAVCTAPVPTSAHVWQPAVADSPTTTDQEARPSHHLPHRQKTDSWERRCSNVFNLKAHTPKAQASQVPKIAEHWSKKSWFCLPLLNAGTVKKTQKQQEKIPWSSGSSRHTLFLSYLKFTPPVFLFITL